MSQEDHDKTLQALLQAAKTEGFTFNENKLIYSIRQLDLLGYRVSHGQKKTTLPVFNRLWIILFLSLRKSWCLGMFAYYARWIANFSKKILPLTRLTNIPMRVKEVQAFES